MTQRLHIAVWILLVLSQPLLALESSASSLASEPQTSPTAVAMQHLANASCCTHPNQQMDCEGHQHCQSTEEASAHHSGDHTGLDHSRCCEQHCDCANSSCGPSLLSQLALAVATSRDNMINSAAAASAKRYNERLLRPPIAA